MAKKFNAENERAKHGYFTYLKEARGRSEAAVDSAAAAVSAFEEFTRFGDFKAFRIKQAIGFKDHLARRRARRSGDPLSAASRYSILRAVQAFFRWLCHQPGYRSRLHYGDAEYFNMSENEVRIAKARRDARYPSLHQILLVLEAAPAGSDIQLRDRAIVAFTILTGARDSAIASFKLKHIDVHNKLVRQDAREVRTKFAKTFPTWFFPVGKIPEQIIIDWVEHLRRDLSWGDDDPLFPSTQISSGGGQFSVKGLARKRWSSAAPIRAAFRMAFERAGLPYFNPHSFRKTLAILGEVVCTTWEEMQAWAQNLGHESMTTTFGSYGQVAGRKQGELMLGLRAKKPNSVPLGRGTG